MLIKWLGLVIFLFAAVSCGGGSDQAPEDTGPAVVGSRITISGTDDFRFQPGSLQVEAGDYEIAFRNEGASFHQLALSREGGHEVHGGDTDEIPGGETKTIDVSLEPGTYEYACHLPGHYEAGMKGTLTVTG